MELISFNNKVYPKFQSEGFASQFAFPYAKKVCRGKGVDVGCNKIDWMIYSENYKSFSHYDIVNYYSVFTDNIDVAFPVDPAIDYDYNSHKFPKFCDKLDFIFSSHCLEHIDDWVGALNYWKERLKSGGILFLYLPDYSQEYWRPWNNKKHKHIFTSDIIYDYMDSNGYKNIFKSGVDLNNSFMIYGEKK